jgi:hypothetical protein
MILARRFADQENDLIYVGANINDMERYLDVYCVNSDTMQHVPGSPGYQMIGVPDGYGWNFTTTQLFKALAIDDERAYYVGVAGGGRYNSTRIMIAVSTKNYGELPTISNKITKVGERMHNKVFDAKVVGGKLIFVCGQVSSGTGSGINNYHEASVYEYTCEDYPQMISQQELGDKSVTDGVVNPDGTVFAWNLNMLANGQQHKNPTVFDVCNGVMVTETINIFAGNNSISNTNIHNERYRRFHLSDHVFIMPGMGKLVAKFAVGEYGASLIESAYITGETIVECAGASTNGEVYFIGTRVCMNTNGSLQMPPQVTFPLPVSTRLPEASWKGRDVTVTASVLSLM